MKTVVIRTDNTSLEYAGCIAEKLNAPLLNRNNTSEKTGHFHFVLHIVNGRLLLEMADKQKTRPFTLDFNKARKGAGADPLLRAIGIQKGTVLDITPGWCGDALHIARRGLNVTAIEKNVIVFVMIDNAKNHISDKALSERINIFEGDSASWMTGGPHRADVVYIDPMFPQKPKSAAARKDLLILRRLTEGQDDGPDNERRLFDAAMRCAIKRVVVKRPHYAESVGKGKVGEIKSKLVRYDLYRPYNS